MASFVGLHREIRDMIYKHLFPHDMRPTVRRYPRHIPFCNAFAWSSASQHISKEAYSVYLSSNNILFDNSRIAYLSLEHIAPYFNNGRDEQQDEQRNRQPEEQPLNLTFDLRHDVNRPLANGNSRTAPPTSSASSASSPPARTCTSRS